MSLDTMIITISGTPGSGKSTIAKKLVEMLHAQRIYVGGIRRELAREKGMTLEQLNEYAQTHPETDVDVDERAAAQARELEKEWQEQKKERREQKKERHEQKESYIIVEGRTQYHFLPESVKLYVKVEFEEGARRIWNDLQEKITRDARNEGDIQSLAQLKEEIRKREESDAFRYKKYYGIDHRDEKQYDFVIDTTHITAEEATARILKYLKNHQ